MMVVILSNKEKYYQEVQEILNRFLETLNDQEFNRYLLSNSNLPSPRVNLELAYAIFDVLAIFKKNDDKKELWSLFLNLSKVNPKKGPTHSPKEFLAFCGIIGIGSLSLNNHYLIPNGLKVIKNASLDVRWRIREAVAHVLNSLIEKHPRRMVDSLFAWIKEENWLLTRAVIAGISHPKLLDNNEFLATSALEFHIEIIKQILGERDRRSHDFKVIRKAMAYTFSVAIAAKPEKGFESIQSLILVNDPDVNWIIRQNLKKNRLKNRFPKKIAEMYETFDNFQY